MRTFLLGAIVAATGLPGVASAACVTIDPVVLPQLRVDPLDASGPGAATQPFTVTFRRAGQGAGAFAVRYQVVDEDSSVVPRVGRSQGPQVQFQARDAARDIGAFRNEAYSLLRSGEVRFDDDQPAVQAQLALRLTDLTEDLAAGVYREQFTLRYWCEAEPEGLPYEQQAAIGVSVAVPNVLSANVAGASTRGEIDFMDFAVRQRSLSLQVRSTGPFQIAAQSANSGYLLRDGGRAGDIADRARYVARLDGQDLPLDGRALPRSGRAGLAGRQMSLEVEVEDVAKKRAGLFADTLLVTLSPVN